MFPCDFKGCTKSYKHKKSLTAHKKNKHNPTGVFSCDKCSYDFKTSADLRLHKREVHPIIKNVKCSYCDKKFKNQATANRHERDKHPDADKKQENGKYKCSYCSRDFIHRGAKNNHERDEHPEREELKQLEHKNDVYDLQIKRSIHEPKAHNKSKQEIKKDKQSEPVESDQLDYDIKYKCSYCDEIYDSPYERSTHEREVHNEYKRILTQETANINRKLIIPKIKASDLRPYKCPIEDCSWSIKGFKRNDHLKNHMESHKDKKDRKKTVPCPDAKKLNCSKMFYKVSKANEHSRNVHHPTKKHKCPEPDCKKGFESAHNLKIHMRTHTGETPFKCGYCGKGHSIKSNRDKHEEMVHEGKINFICEECDAPFYQNCDFKQHMESVHGKNTRFECDECGYKCYNKGDMKKHIDRVHKGIRDIECEYANCIYDCILPAEMKAHILNNHVHGLKKGSIGEKIIHGILTDMKVKFGYDMRYDELTTYSNQNLRFDFILRIGDKIKFIEYDGIQHFAEVDCWGGADGLAKRQGKDALKDSFCKKYGYEFLRVSDIHKSNLNEIIPMFVLNDFTSDHNINNIILEYAEAAPLPENVNEFKCKICHKVLGNARNLKRHEENHTGKKQYECKECNKKFARKCNWTRHMKTHSGVENNYKCEICKFAASTRSRLTKHLKTAKHQKNMKKAKEQEAKNNK